MFLTGGLLCLGKNVDGTYRFPLLSSSSCLSRVSHDPLLRSESILVQITEVSSEKPLPLKYYDV